MTRGRSGAGIAASIAAVVLIAVAVRAFVAPPEGREGGAGTEAEASGPPGTRVAPDVASPPEAPGAETLAAARQASPTHRPRQRVDTPPSGRVATREGDPVAGATVSWTPLSVASALPSAVPWSQRDAQLVLDRSVFDESDALGRFEFDGVPQEEAAIVWVSAPGHAAAAARVDAGTPARGLVVTLDAAPELAARVVAGGEPAAGAVVWQLGVAGPVAEPAELGPEAFALLVRRHAVDDAGETELHPLPGESGVLARRGSLSSKPRSGRLEGTLVLELRETFEATGTVTWGEGIDEDGDYRVAIAARRAHLREPLLTVPVSAAGSWGPAAVPLVDADGFSFTLGGGNAVPAEETLEPPEPSSRVHVDLEATAGHGLWAFVSGPAGEPLYEASVQARWRTPDYHWEWVAATPFPEDHRFAGYVWLDGIPEGSVRLHAHCADYQSVETAMLPVPPPDPVAHEVRLRPAGGLRGVVLHHGQPVPTFELCYWSPDAPSPSSWKRTFTDRVDGTFEVDDAPTGQVALFASAPGIPRSPTALTEVGAGEMARVTLELADGLPGAGRVVDQANGEPLPTARVQRFSSDSMRVVAYWGVPAAVGLDGRFELDGFLPGRNVVEALADGYASTFAWAESDGERVDFGDISLARTQTLRVELSGVPRGALGSYSVDVTGFNEVYGTRFSADGVAAVGPLAPYPRYTVTLRRGGERVQDKGVDLVVGQDWRVAFTLGTDTRLEVHVVPAPGTEVPGSLVVSGSAVEAGGVDGVVVAASAPVEGSLAVLAGLPPGDVSLRAELPDGRVLARGSARVEPGATAASLLLDERERRFRVVDGAERPLAGVKVYVGSDDEWPRYLGEATSDAEGEFALAGLPSGFYRLLAFHQTEGSAPFRVEIDEGAPDVHELRFVGDGALTLAVSDGEGPLAGARCCLYAFGGQLAVQETLAAADGTSTWKRLGRGPYTVTAEHPGHWSVREPLEVDGSALRRTAVLLPVGTLELQARSTGGAPASGVAIDLRHDELGEAVSEWVAAGRLQAGEGGLATDERGRLVLPGLPVGRYSWRAGRAEGTVELDAQGSTARLALPD